MTAAFATSVPVARWGTSNPHFRSPAKRHSAFLTTTARRSPSITARSDRNEDAAEHARLSQDFAEGSAKASFGFKDPVFANAVSGEWFGYECAFAARDGKPINIPEHYIPDEFRNWGVEIKGFDCVTSTQRLQDDRLLVKRTRALPSVGCEADAVVPEVAEQIFHNVGEGTINGGFPDGTFSCGPACLTERPSQRWNVGLMDPTNGSKSRVRLEFGLVNQPFSTVTVFLEHWDAPFCNGEVLPGCGGRNQSFDTDSVLEASTALLGTWTVESTIYSANSGNWKLENMSSIVERTTSNASREVAVGLPRGVSVGITSGTDGAKTVVAAWLTASNLRIVSRRKYHQSGTLLSVSRAIERRQS